MYVAGAALKTHHPFFFFFFLTQRFSFFQSAAAKPPSLGCAQRGERGCGGKKEEGRERNKMDERVFGVGFKKK